MKSKEQGFTLIELLVCMLIIGALTTIAIQAYSIYTTKAHEVEMVMEERNTAINEVAITIDNNG